MSCYWSPFTHWRFSDRDRYIVLVLLCIQRRTRFLLKDILIHQVIPCIFGRLRVPALWVTINDEYNKTFNFQELCNLLPFPVADFARAHYFCNGYIRFMSMRHLNLFMKRLDTDGTCQVGEFGFVKFQISTFGQLELPHTK